MAPVCLGRPGKSRNASGESGGFVFVYGNGVYYLLVVTSF